MSVTIDLKDVNRALRRTLWPAVKACGFQFRTDRAAWRYLDDAVDLIDIQSVGSGADAVGCTSFSFSAYAGTLPMFIGTGVAGSRRGTPSEMPKARPHYWDTQLQFGIEKTLHQPWFEPFANPPAPTTPEPLLVHREALKEVLRRDRHDRPDIWYVLPDGSNLDEVMGDLTRAVTTQAVPLLDRMHDPCELLGLIEGGWFVRVDSPVGRDLADKARQVCASTRDHVTFSHAD
jgi:hypothetical protein